MLLKTAVQETVHDLIQNSSNDDILSIQIAKLFLLELAINIYI